MPPGSLVLEAGGRRAEPRSSPRTRGYHPGSWAGDESRRCPPGPPHGPPPGGTAARSARTKPAGGARLIQQQLDAPTTLRDVAVPLGATFAIQTLVALSLIAAPVLAPVVAPELGLSPTAVGYYITIAYVGSMAGTITAGGWVARFGPMRVSQLALAACVIGTLLAATAWPPAIVLAALFVGLGYGPASPASSQILARSAPPSIVALTFSLKQTGVPVGGILAGALIPGLSLWLGWQAAALFIGALCLLLLLAVQPLRPRYDRSADPTASISLRAIARPLRMVLREPELREMTAASFVFASMQATLTTYLVTFITEDFGVGVVTAGLVMAVSQAASVAGRLGWGAMADRRVTRRVMLGLLGLGMFACTSATLTTGGGWPLWLLFLFAAAFGATAVGWNGVFLAEVAHLAGPDRASPATGGALFFTFLGVVITPPLFNLVLATSGSFGVTYAIFGLPALVIGVRLLRGGSATG